MHYNSCHGFDAAIKIQSTQDYWHQLCILCKCIRHPIMLFYEFRKMLATLNYTFQIQNNVLHAKTNKCASKKVQIPAHFLIQLYKHNLNTVTPNINVTAFLFMCLKPLESVILYNHYTQCFTLERLSRENKSVNIIETLH